MGRSQKRLREWLNCNACLTRRGGKVGGSVPDLSGNAGESLSEPDLQSRPVSPRNGPALTSLLCSVRGWEQSVGHVSWSTRADGFQSLAAGDPWSRVAPVVGVLPGGFPPHKPIERPGSMKIVLCDGNGVILVI